MDLGVMAMKEYSTLSRAQEPEYHYQMQFNVILILPSTAYPCVLYFLFNTSTTVSLPLSILIHFLFISCLLSSPFTPFSFFISPSLSLIPIFPFFLSNFQLLPAIFSFQLNFYPLLLLPSFYSFLLLSFILQPIYPTCIIPFYYHLHFPLFFPAGSFLLIFSLHFFSLI